jgi:ribosomal-protein-serine acetyltransferase
MARLPQRIEANDLLLRRWEVSDAALQEQAIAESADHLRPWMAWIAEEPKSLQERRALLASWVEDWKAGGDAVFAVFANGEIAGSAGLHRRAGPETLEIGYWIGVRFLRRGLATRVAAMLTEAAFCTPGITCVEIHHDKANIPSEAIPRRLGFRLIGERADEPEAPGELGVERTWRLERADWEQALGDTDTVRIVAPANETDANALRELHLATWEPTYRSRAAESWYRERLAAHRVRDWGEVIDAQAAAGGDILVARSGGEIVGICQYGSSEDADQDSSQVGQIYRLYVHPTRQGTGIGRSLLDASLDGLRRAGKQAATLWVLETDQRARGFYERLGWQPDGARMDHPPTDVRYRLALPA